MTELENLVRQAVAAEADERVDPRTVLAELRRRKARRPFGVVAAVGLAVAAIVVAVVVLVPRTSPTATTATPPASGQTVLLMGIDEYRHADAIVLARVGSTGALSFVSLQRDTWVDVDGRQEKLSSIFATGGAAALVKAVEALTGTKIDHHASVEMTRFGAVADALGGVEVCLLRPARDDLSGTDLPAGRQVLSGERALAFLRQRFGLAGGDLDRVTRQQAFLVSVAAKIAGHPDRFGELVKAVAPHVRTDEGWDVLAFGKQMTKNAIVRTGTIPVGEQTTGTNGASGLSADPAEVRDFVTKYLVEGTDAPGSAAPSTEGPNPGCVN